MLAFTPAIPEPITTTGIIIDGKRVGRVDQHGDQPERYRFHAVIEMREVGDHRGDMALAQGHGASPEAAVEAAISGGVVSARAYIAALELLGRQACLGLAL